MPFQETQLQLCLLLKRIIFFDDYQLVVPLNSLPKSATVGAEIDYAMKRMLTQTASYTSKPAPKRTNPLFDPRYLKKSVATGIPRPHQDEAVASNQAKDGPTAVNKRGRDHICVPSPIVLLHNGCHVNGS